MMQPATKKRPSFAGARSALKEKENKAKSQRVPTATVLLPFPSSIRAVLPALVSGQLAACVTSLPERRGKHPARNSSVLIKFFLFAPATVMSVLQIQHFGSNSCPKETLCPAYL